MTQNFTSKDVCCGLTNRYFSTAGRMGKPVFPCPHFSLPLFHSHIYFFFPTSRFPSSIQSRAICPQSTFFIFYATLSFKAFCSWLVTELLPISSESSPSSCAHRSSSQSSPSAPEAARLGVHLWVCLPGCGSPEGFQLPGTWPWGGEEEHKGCSCELGSVSYRKEQPSI